MKKIVLLGSTGSIGTSTLQVIDHLPGKFKVLALAAHSNIDLLETQAKKYHPKLIAVFDEKRASELRKRVAGIKIVSGLEGLLEAALIDEAEMVVTALVGTLGIEPTYRAILAGKKVALANKEALVSAGKLIMEAAVEGQILPIDSEHSALFQCLMGEEKNSVRRLILTASGGPFRNFQGDEFKSITPEMALKHPSWNMGAKVTVDCSTLMNKGLEMIEAHYLFKTEQDKIDIVIHPQSIIHSMVEFKDGSMKAQLSEPDMKLPIQFALTYPEREHGILSPFDFKKFSKLEFFPADTVKFKCLGLAYESLKKSASYPGYLNAADEVLVNRFLKKEISWHDIGEKLERLLENHQAIQVDSLEAIQEVDKLARRDADAI